MALQTSTPVVQDPRLVELGINVIRGIAMDAPEQANSGHSGTAMALAPLAHVLWTRIMNYDPRDPEWPDHDRFVLSNGHACILQYSMLHLTGYDLSLEDLRQFRQWGSRTPGHPEAGHTAGIDVTTGPLGQGVGDAVGMAIAERWLRTTFGREVCDHRTYVIAGDGCFMEGVSHEAASLAGHLGLGRLLAFYDDNHITIDGPTELAYDDNVPERFEAYGWRVRNLGEMANDVDGLEAAIREALDEPADGPDAKPTLLVLRSHIGWPSPKLTDTAAAHGSPFGAEEIKVTKEILGLPTDQTFWVPDEVRDFYGQQIARGAERHAEWTERFEAWKGDRAAWDAAQAGHGLAGWADDLPTFEAGKRAGHPPRHQPVHRRHRGQAARPAGRLGRPDRQQRREGQGRRDPVAPDARRDPGPLRDPRARHGIGHERHGPARGRAAGRRDVLLLLRLHAPLGPPGLADGDPRHLLVDPRLGRAGRGRTDPPADRAPGLAAGHARPQPRAPGRRQRDGAGLAAGRRGGRAGRPGADPPGRPRAGGNRRAGARRRAPGGLRPRRQRRAASEIVLVGTGSEVQHCVTAAATLAASGVQAQVVSFPSWDHFERQPEDYRATVFPPGVPVLSIEAGATFGWDRYADDAIGFDHFGASAPGALVMEKFGITAEHMVERARALLGLTGG